MKRVVGLVLFFTLFSGCAAMEQDYRDNYCNYSGAYKKGYNDARHGSPMEENNLSICYPEQRPEASRGYQEGYLTARSEMGRPRVIIQPGYPTQGYPAGPYPAQPTYPSAYPPPSSAYPPPPPHSAYPPSPGYPPPGAMPPLPPAPSGAQPMACHRDKDCPKDASCQDRGDGIWVCLGGGAH